MVELLQILIAVALISFIILVIKIFISLGKVEVLLNKTSDSLDMITKEISNMSHDINEMIKDVKELKAKANTSIDKIEDFSENLKLISYKSIKYFDDIRGLTKPYEQLVHDAYPKIAEPVNKTLAVISAASKAFTTFREKLSRK